jgi:L-glyceraldehyde 3-phosphate reductase
MLSDRYIDEVPADSRAGKSGTAFSRKLLTEKNLSNIRNLNKIAQSRGQSLAQMALAWNLRHPQVTSVLVGTSSIHQIEQNVEALKNLDFSSEELKEIDKFAIEGDINLWAASSEAG